MRKGEKIIEAILFGCSALTLLTTLGIILVLSFETIGFFREVSIIEFLTDTEWTPLFSNKRFGIMPLLAGTFLVTAISLVVAVPLGLVIAIYLSEYAPGWFREIVKPVLEILAAIPTVVYGYFALVYVTPMLQNMFPDQIGGFNALSPGIVMGIMILPLISSLSEDALYAVPRSLKEGSFGMGATKLQTVRHVLIPAAFSGISVSIVLALSRAIGETMIVAIAAGQQPRLTANPLVPIETATTYIVQVTMGDVPYDSLEYRTIFAVGMTLFVITLILNNVSFWLKKRYHQAYS